MRESGRKEALNLNVSERRLVATAQVRARTTAGGKAEGTERTSLKGAGQELLEP